MITGLKYPNIYWNHIDLRPESLTTTNEDIEQCRTMEHKIDSWVIWHRNDEIDFDDYLVQRELTLLELYGN